MATLRLRKGAPHDDEWLFELFRDTMRDYIHQAWGWDEIFQREAFSTNLPGKHFHILEVDQRKTGAYSVFRKPDHLWLELILIEPAQQRAGHGSFLLETVKQQALRDRLPLKLTCLKCNPAAEFYRKREFVTTHDDPKRFHMEWQQPA
ncbi:MAG: hypothetical protein RLZZ385_1532 [Pseudomonadota bacterium]|jgi:GNAT superfamily N-acetyltransferase